MIVNLYLFLIFVFCTNVSVISIRGISLSKSTSKTFKSLRNVDMIAFYEDVVKTGCWIYYVGNFKPESKDDSDVLVELPAKIQILSKPQNSESNFPTPFVTNSNSSMANGFTNKNGGLSFVARSKRSFCFVTLFYWSDARDDVTDLGKMSKATERMVEYVEHDMLSCAGLRSRKRFFFHGKHFAPKWTLVFLETVSTLQQKQDGDEDEEKWKQNPVTLATLSQRILEYFLNEDAFDVVQKFLPLFLIAVSAKFQTVESFDSLQGKENQSEMKITDILQINHLSFLNKKLDPAESSCPNLEDTSKQEFSCYNSIMSSQYSVTYKNHHQHQVTGFPILLSTPAHRTDPSELRFTVGEFLASSLNDSSSIVHLSKSSSFWNLKNLNIKIFHNLQMTFLNASDAFIITGSKEFKFVTSDGVSKLKTSLEFYTTPFQKEVWTLLFVSMATTVIILTAMILIFIKNKGKDNTFKIRIRFQILKKIWNILSKLCLWILRILLEQPDQEIPPGVQIEIHQNWIKNLLNRAFHLMLGVWLMMSLILVNAYRGIIKSEYALEFPFVSEPKWNSSLDFFKDESFLIYYTNFDFSCQEKLIRVGFNITIAAGVNRHDQTLVTSHLDTRRKNILDYQQDMGECVEVCSNKKLKLPFETSGCQTYESCQRLHKHFLIMQRDRYLCVEDLPKKIKSELRHPKTVFLTEAEEFPLHWNEFMKQMKKNPQLGFKFVHNRQQKDEAVRELEVFNVYLGRVQNEPELVLRPLEILLSSGIFWWWEKWDNIIFHDIIPFLRMSDEYIDESLPVFKPLSFKGSEIHLVFLAWILLLSLPLAVFLLEIKLILCYKMLKFVNRILENQRKPRAVVHLLVSHSLWLDQDEKDECDP